MNFIQMILLVVGAKLIVVLAGVRNLGDFRFSNIFGQFHNFSANEKWLEFKLQNNPSDIKTR